MVAPANTIWTTERVEHLRQMHAEGKSASIIANELDHVVTRNAVMGKLARMNLRCNSLFVVHDGASIASKQRGRGPTQIRKVPTVPYKSLVLVPRPHKPVDPEAFKTPYNITIFDLNRNVCHWPTTDVKPLLYCGRPVALKSSYCPYHSKMSGPGR